MDLIHQAHLCRGGLIHQARNLRGIRMREEEKGVVDCRGLIHQAHLMDLNRIY